MGAAVLANVARRGQLDSALDERSFRPQAIEGDMAPAKILLSWSKLAVRLQGLTTKANFYYVPSSRNIFLSFITS